MELNPVKTVTGIGADGRNDTIHGYKRDNEAPALFLADPDQD
jgi:hypothetical protein